MRQAIRDHLSEAGESYLQHFRFATTVGLLAIAAGVACIIHALVPSLCTRTASRTIRQLTLLFDERERIGEVTDRSTDTLAFVLLLILATAVVAPLWLLDAPFALCLGYSIMAYAVPLTLLLTNRELEKPLEEAAA